MTESPVATRRKPRAAVTWVAWFLGALTLVSCSLWVFAGYSWLIDLVANLGAQMLFGALMVAAIVAIARRWKPLVVVLVACGMQLIPLVRHRAAYWPRSVDDSRVRGPDEVRFLHYNDSSQSDKADVYALMEREHADVASILCPPVRMQFDVVYGPGLEDAYPGKLTRPWEPAPDGTGTLVTAAFVVSRWHMTRYDCAFVGPLANRFIAAVVERPPAPTGRFGLIAVHPRSPRWETRWSEGNSVVEALIAIVGHMRAEGLPVVVLTDLNSTPTGWRSRLVCDLTGLSRAKPLLTLDGTYPDVLPFGLLPRQKTRIPARWPLNIAIDDALVSPGIEVTGWRVGERLLSEHRPVTIELRIPSAAALRANPTDR